MLDGGRVCLLVDDEEVLLRVWGGSDMLITSWSDQEAGPFGRYQRDTQEIHTPTPARSSPVTESYMATLDDMAVDE